MRTHARWKLDYAQATRQYIASQGAAGVDLSSVRAQLSNAGGGGGGGPAGGTVTANTAPNGNSPQAPGNNAGAGGNTGSGSGNNTARNRSRENGGAESRDMEMYRRLLYNELEPSTEDDFGEVMVGERKVLQARENSNIFAVRRPRCAVFLQFALCPARSLLLPVVQAEEGESPQAEERTLLFVAGQR